MKKRVMSFGSKAVRTAAKWIYDAEKAATFLPTYDWEEISDIYLDEAKSYLKRFGVSTLDKGDFYKKVVVLNKKQPRLRDPRWKLKIS